MSDAPATEGLTTDTAPTQGTLPIDVPADNDDPFAEPAPDQAVFNRSYVESLRSEGAKYRTRASDVQSQLGVYQDTFDGYEQEDVEAWLDLVRTWKMNPLQAAQVMNELSTNALREMGGGAGNAGAPGPADQPEPVETPAVPTSTMSPEQIQALIDERFTAREAQQTENTLIKEIYAEIRAAGYDPEGDGFQILYDANHFTNGNIPQAIDRQRAREQRVIDTYVQGRSSGTVPMPTPGGGVQATPAVPEIKTIEDARRATEAFLRERRSAS